MHGTTAHRRYRPHAEGAPYASQPYWGWSHRHQRMEFMDLPTYVDSVQQGYDAAFGDLVGRMQQLGSPAAAAPGPAAPGAALARFPAAPARGRHGHHEHGCHEHGCHEHGHDDPGYHGDCHHGDCRHEHGGHEHGPRWGGRHECDERDCGCGCGHARGRDHGCDHDWDCGEGGEHRHGCGPGRRRERDCRCDCCIVDADVIVYAHCGEVRVVPIEVANDTRKIRENVDVQVSDVRSAGGTELAWPVIIAPQGPLTLEPCSTTRLDLTVHVACGAEPGKASPGRSGAAKGAPADAFTALTAQRESGSDVDRCEVGYTTIRLGGCLVRPVVVAVAALPLGCDSYRVGCSCSCCC